MKQRFNNQVLTMTKTVNNILRVFDEADCNGYDWYIQAHEFARGLAGKYLLPKKDADKQALTKVCGIIASLSPLKTWEQNKIIAEGFLRDGKVKHIKLFKGKAKDILLSDGNIDTVAEILNGNKITSFFLNILDPYNNTAVTIDRHAVSIAIGENIDPVMTDNQYEFFVNAYRIAATKRNVRPSQMQAITWVKWRELKGYVEPMEDDLPF